MERPWSRLVDALRSPEAVTDGIQITKTVVAATAAWYVSTTMLGSPMPFLAPWTALLTVHATAYRSLSRGAQTTVASTAGVALSFVIGYFLGVDVWTFALAILVGLVVSRISWLRDEGVAIATTAIFILAGGFEQQAPFLDDRLLEVALGVAFGIIVNLAFLPPLRDRQAARYVDSMNRRMGEVMISMADELGRSWDTDRADTWVDETVAMDDELDSAWQTVRFARESRRLNPRHHVPVPGHPRHWRNRHGGAGRRAGYEDILTRLGEGVSHLRHLARTLRESSYSDSAWDEEFRSQWVALVHDAGSSIKDPDAEVESIYDRLDGLSRRFSDGTLAAGELWPVYGSLITSVRHITIIVDDVSSAREAREADKSNPVV